MATDRFEIGKRTMSSSGRYSGKRDFMDAEDVGGHEPRTMYLTWTASASDSR